MNKINRHHRTPAVKARAPRSAWMRWLQRRLTPAGNRAGRVGEADHLQALRRFLAAKLGDCWMQMSGRDRRLYHRLTQSESLDTLRQLRFLIGRLPVIPRYPLFRERYSVILWDKRWNWLNYFDFSLNNLLRFGFNDIRLRDEHMPGLVTALAWYQWSIGILYFALLLWTLSRTIPGLNLLIYFK